MRQLLVMVVVEQDGGAGSVGDSGRWWRCVKRCYGSECGGVDGKGGGGEAAAVRGVHTTGCVGLIFLMATPALRQACFFHLCELICSPRLPA